MINSVRNIVLAILNKNNYGYLSPSDFNLLAKKAQLSLFINYMSEYNKVINMENKGMSGEGYANLGKFSMNELDTFSVTSTLTKKTGNEYYLPSEITTGYNMYFLNSVMIYQSGVYTGTSEQVPEAKKNELLVMMDMAPTTTFPIHTLAADTIKVYPSTITGESDVKAQYIRYPLDPKWTFIELSGGEPVFDESAADYQDFEVGEDHYVDLVVKILQYSGLEIREPEVVQTMNALEIQSKSE